MNGDGVHLSHCIGPDVSNCGASEAFAVTAFQSDTLLERLKGDWNRLSDDEEDPNPFGSFPWFESWIRWHRQQDPHDSLKPWVLELKQNGKTTGISPLVLRSSSHLLPVRKLGFCSEHADYNDLILGNKDIGQAEAVADFLAGSTSQWDIADLRELRDSGSATDLFEQALKRAGMHCRVLPESEVCPFLLIDGNADFAMSKLSGQVRRTLRRRRERAAAEGMRVRIIERPDKEPGLIESLALLDQKKREHRSCPLFLAAHPDVFRRLFHDLGPRGLLYVALLELKNQLIAFQFGFRCRKKLWDYAKAYDRSFSRFAPGTLLLLGLLDYCFERGYREYDFLRGSEEYKLLWSVGCHRRSRIIIWNDRLRSLLQAHAYLRFRIRPVSSA
jgi:CelD/BcsL family acetyltransferase involved in cellulose biosynthesis